MGSRCINMRYFISFILILFCSVSLFAQNNSDTATITLKGVTLTWKQVQLKNFGTICSFERKRKQRIIRCPVSVMRIKEQSTYNITHQNHSEFGLPTYPFRFENVNQMANTVAGVLSMDGERPSILGARREATAYYLNKVRILEGFLPDTGY